MKTFCLHPIRQISTDSDRTPLLCVSSSDCEENPPILWITKQGGLRISPAQKVRETSRRMASLLHRESAGANPQWLLTPLSEELLHNGIRPLPLAIIEPGEVLAFEGQCWLTSELWQPTPAPAPEKIAEKECPVCGGALKLAPVIQCPCGRYYHLEHPETPDDPQALNCYLTAGMCGLCERKPSLDPQFLPLPPEELIPQEHLDAALAAV